MSSNSDDSESSESGANLDELKAYVSMVLSRTCTRIERMTSGRNHEIFVLYFSALNGQGRMMAHGEEEWSCIARVSIIPEIPEKLISEAATLRLIKSSTTIPVPEVYHTEFNVGNPVGAQFMLMQRLPGRPLYQDWDTMDLNQKKILVFEVARVVAQLSNLKFDQIGCVMPEGLVGPLIYPSHRKNETYEPHVGPYASTLDYLLSFIPSESDGEASVVYSKVKSILSSYLSTHSKSVAFAPPFGLIHPDFDSQNILVAKSTDSGMPYISGVLDWEYAQTGPLYFSYEYPIFIQDSDDNKLAYTENAVLRSHFVHMLLQLFPSQSNERSTIKMCMKKNYIMNGFRDIFMIVASMRELFLKRSAEEYVENVENGSGQPYEGNYRDVLDDKC